MPLVANNLIIIGLWKILGAKGAEDYKHVSKYQLVMGQPVCKGVCLEDRGEGTKKSNPGGLLVFYQRSSSETESFLRAWRRRALRTRRPLALAILARKPCLFTRLRREGWNVLFILSLFYFFRIRDCKGSNSPGKNKIIFQYGPPVFLGTRNPAARPIQARYGPFPGPVCAGPSPERSLR